MKVCKDLDEFFNYNTSIMIYGEATTGKTTCCLLTAIEYTKKGKVIFLDTENSFSIERIKQLCPNYKSRLNNILLFKINNFDEQRKQFNKLKEIVKSSKAKLVIIDTIGMHYRIVLKKDPYSINKEMDRQLRILNEISKEIPVLITNQVYHTFDGEIKMVGGNMLRNWSKCLIKLQKNPRKIILQKPEKKEMFFKMIERGIIKI